jgi:lipoprotein-releasing system permease protein
MEDAQVLYRMDGNVSGVRLKVKSIDAAPRIARELAQRIPPEVFPTDWTQQNVNYFRAIQIEKRMIASSSRSSSRSRRSTWSPRS